MQKNITALDGRYSSSVTELDEICSEFGLMKYRVQVEVAWLSFLKKQDFIPTEIVVPELQNLVKNFSQSDYESIKEIESVTRHDVKAVEYFLQKQTEEKVWPWIHFACTSEDINNLAYALMV